MQANHQTHVDQRQRCRERTIHQRAIDEYINVPQPRAQHGNPKGERDEEHQEAVDGCGSRHIERIGRSYHRENQTQHIAADIDNHGHRETEDHPFRLLTLHGTGHLPVAVELDEHQNCRLAKRHKIAKRINQGIWHGRPKERRRDQPCKKDDEEPARPARHELPVGEQEEDEHQQGKSEVGQTFIRYLPGGGTHWDRAGDDDGAKRHQ